MTATAFLSFLAWFTALNSFYFVVVFATGGVLCALHDICMYIFLYTEHRMLWTKNWRLWNEKEKENLCVILHNRTDNQSLQSQCWRGKMHLIFCCGKNCKFSEWQCGGRNQPSSACKPRWIFLLNILQLMVLCLCECAFLWICSLHSLLSGVDNGDKTNSFWAILKHF